MKACTQNDTFIQEIEACCCDLATVDTSPSHEESENQCKAWLSVHFRRQYLGLGVRIVLSNQSLQISVMGKEKHDHEESP